MYRALLALVIVGLTINSLIAQDVVLDFSDDHTLKTVFDAGLRPYRRPNLETLQLRAEAVRTSVTLPGGVIIPPSNWDSLDFNVVSDGHLSTMSLRTGPITIESAQSIFLSMLNAQRLSTEKMDAFLSEVKTQPLFFEGEYHVGTGDRSNPSRLVAFRRTGQKDAPLAVEVILDWQFEPKSARRAYYKEPIPPPPGYENVSMEKPSYVAKNKPDSAIQGSSTTIATPQPTKPPSSPHAEGSKESSASAFPVTSIAIALILIAGALVFYLRRKSP